MTGVRVLMLGWEFPPLVNGGLGVACYGLAKALAKKVRLQVMVPKVDGLPADDGFSLLGMNRVTPGDLVPAGKHYRYESFAQVEHIPVSLPAYAQAGGGLVERRMARRRKAGEFSRTSDEQLAVFQIDDLYGDDLGLKVLEFSRVVAMLAMQRDFDVVHAHDWMTFLAGVEVKRATHKPFVAHLHSSQYDRVGPEARDWIYELERYGMEEADRVIPVSRYTGRILVEHYGIDVNKLRPVHNGVDPVIRYRSRKKFPEKLVLFLGRLTSQKGPEFFLDIAARVLDRKPNVRFVMAGTGDRFMELIESGAYRGLGGRFHFTGFLGKERVHELLSMADVYCMPSVSEPFGLSALEAAQFGIPAVLSKQSGVSEVLPGALKADFWDTELMARHIVDLLDDGSLRARVAGRSQAGLAAATWAAAAVKVAAVYEELT